MTIIFSGLISLRICILIDAIGAPHLGNQDIDRWIGNKIDS